MSRKATILTTEDVPKYIKEIVARLYPISSTEPVWNDARTMPGYTFKLYGRRKLGAEIGSRQDAEKLVKWAKSWYAHAEIIDECLWYDRVETGAYSYSGSKAHKAKAYREGFRNRWYIIITDPVCHRFEKDEFYRNGS